MTIEEVVRNIYQLRKEIKAKEAEVDNLRIILINKANLEVTPQTHVHDFPYEMFKNSEEVLSYFLERYPEQKALRITPHGTETWEVVSEDRVEFIPYTTEADGLKVSRSFAQSKPQIDLERLRDVDPLFYDNITSTKEIRELDEDMLERYLEEYPGAMATLQRCIKVKTPKVVVRVDELKDEE